MELTQIQINKKTRKRLKNLKLTNRESYNEIINRVLDKYEN